MKTINCKILKLVSILLFSCLFACIGEASVSAADEKSIDVYSNVYNASSEINVEFEYSITPSGDNPAGASNEPTNLKIKFDNVVPEDNIATVVGQIDFSGTSYSTFGIYKYEVREIASSNPDYPLSSEGYEIYVLAANTGTTVNQQAKNLDDDTKGNINFNHNPERSYIRINLTVHGDEMDQQEFFRFKVSMDSLCIGCQYDMIGQDEYVRYNGQIIKTSDKFTVYNQQASTRVHYAVQNEKTNASAKLALYSNNQSSRRTATYVASSLPNYVYMKHAQSVTIGLSADGQPQIPVGTLVKVMGDENLDMRKWTMYIDGVETREFEHVVGEEIDFDIVLERDMVVPNTGIFMESLPYIALIIFGVGGIVLFAGLKARNAK